MEKQKLWSILAAVLGVCFVFLLFFSNSRLTDLRILENKNAAAIAQAKAELEELDARPAAKEDKNEGSPGEDAPADTGLLELGNAVSGFQNAYASLNAAEDVDAFSANVEALDGCFTDTDKGARVPWYTGSLPGAWGFTAGSGRGLWLCRSNEGGHLLAYATADYDAEANQFFNVRYEMSIEANGSVKAEEGKVPDDKVDDINNMADTMKNTPAPETPGETDGSPTEPEGGQDGDITDIKEAQWRMRQEMMEGGGKNED